MRVEDARQIESEESVVWLDHAARNLPYVREGTMLLPSRGRAPSRRLTWHHVVAYATLQPAAHSVHPGRFRRRVWHLAGHDPYPDGGGPSEAVNPLSIAAAQLSEPMTDEQWNRNGVKTRDWK